MGVALYTSRVVLNELGVEDFGVYNVVGGIVTMLSFINGSMSTATSRFLAFELGKGDEKKVKETFQASFMVHLMIAVFIFFIAETVGLWFLENELVIPENRMFAARVVYQFSIFSCLVGITQAPYNASIIAHEKMEIYACISIIDALLKLSVAFILCICDTDKLILYAVLVFVVWVIVGTIYRIYCTYCFNECRCSIKYDRGRFRAILFFSGWNLIGSLGNTFRGQGINILQNIFFGSIINAATAIAGQVFAALSTFSDSFLAAVRPQIIKNYAVQNYVRVESLIINASKFAFLLLSLFAIPLVLENEILLNVWLREVPDHAVSFCQLNIVGCMVLVFFQLVSCSIHATGHVKYLNILIGLIYMAILPISYIFLQKGYSPIIPYVVSIFAFILVAFFSLYILRRYMPTFSIRKYVFQVYGRCWCVLVLSCVLPFIIHQELAYGLIRFILVFCASALSICVFSYYIAIDRVMRKRIVDKIQEVFLKR